MDLNKLDLSRLSSIIEEVAKRPKRVSKATIILSQMHEPLKQMLLPIDKGGKDFTFSQVSAVILELTGEKIGNQSISKYAKEFLGIERISPIKARAKEQEKEQAKEQKQESKK